MSDTDGDRDDDVRDRPAARRLPRWARAVLLAVVLVLAIVVLFLYVFPWVESWQQDPTLDAVQRLRAPR